MLTGNNVRAVLLHEPWLDGYRLTMGHVAGKYTYVVAGIENGRLKYEQVEGEAVVAEPFVTLTQDEVDAIVAALRRDARPVDAAQDAIRDARETRDRLLSMIEKRGLR